MRAFLSPFAPKRRVHRPRRSDFLPQVEALEERCCPSGGIVEWEDPAIRGYAWCVATQSDGKIVAGGMSIGTRGAPGWYSTLYRLNSDGSFDSTFGSGGVLRIQPQIWAGSIRGVTVQPDGKIVAAAGPSNSAVGQFTVTRFNSNGSLDTTFGGGKKPSGVAKITVTSDTGNTTQVSGVALQADGKIVVSGTVSNTTTADDFGVVRFTSSGTIDSTFGSGGLVITDLGGTNGDFSNDLTIQGDGKILVGGNSAFVYPARQ